MIRVGNFKSLQWTLQSECFIASDTYGDCFSLKEKAIRSDLSPGFFFTLTCLAHPPEITSISTPGSHGARDSAPLQQTPE
jgi:hypothetical protein